MKTLKNAIALSAKNKRISYPSAVMNRLGGETGLSGALQELQRGSHPMLTTRSGQ